MFEVYNKETLEKVKVYGVGEDSCGYPKFLIRKDNQWIWRSAKHFITEEEYWITVEKGKTYPENIKVKCPRVQGSMIPKCMYLHDGILCTIRKYLVK